MADGPGVSLAAPEVAVWFMVVVEPKVGSVGSGSSSLQLRCCTCRKVLESVGAWRKKKAGEKPRPFLSPPGAPSLQRGASYRNGMLFPSRRSSLQAARRFNYSARASKGPVPSTLILAETALSPDVVRASCPGIAC